MQREDPIPDGGSWTINDGAQNLNENVDFRARCVSIEDGGDSCTAYLYFEYRLDGGDWKTHSYSKFQDVQHQLEQPISWFLGDRTQSKPGTYDFRTRNVYDGSTYYSNTITIEVSGAWVEQEPPADSSSESTPPAGSSSESQVSAGSWTEGEVSTVTATEETVSTGSFTEQEPPSVAWSETQTTSGSFTESESPSENWGEVTPGSDTWSETESSAGGFTAPGLAADPDWVEKDSA